MKKTNDFITSLDGPLKELDQDMVWNEERKLKLRYQVMANLDKQESKVRFSRGFKAASSLMLSMIILFAGYLFISQTIGNDSDGSSSEPGNNTETIPPVIEPEESADEENREAIQAVIEKEFTGPDEQYKALLDAAMEAQISDEYMDDYEAYLESPEYLALMTYMEETYAPYFTENGYENFINATPAFRYSSFEQEYELSPSDIEINQSENGETLYDFTFQVEYTDENGESSQFDFEGSAIVPEEGKIGQIEYMDDLEDGLLQVLTNNE